jgi:Glyoxalase-like domain
MAVARTGFVSLDCADPLALGEFWAAMLGGEIMFTSATTVGIRTEWVWLSTLKVAGYVAPTWPEGDIPKQIHLDLAVTELEAAVAEAERLGARIAPVQPAPDRWRVLLDPAGHPFCLTTQIPPEAL